MTDLMQSVETPGAASALRKVRIPVLTAVAMIFIFVSSGAFGIEDMTRGRGRGSRSSCCSCCPSSG